MAARTRQVLVLLALLVLWSVSADATRVLQMVSPNGGESFVPGQEIPIKWDATPFAEWYGSDSIKLEYSTDSGATWLQVAGADNLWCYFIYNGNTSTFFWDTTGLPESDNYRVKVTCLDDTSIADASDADFTIDDNSPPTITHTPLQDTTDLSGPYVINATVTDLGGLDSVIFYWSRNGGDFQSVPMTAGGNNQYSAAIPGAGLLGDRYCYYIEARDSSHAANVSRSPAADAYCFNIIPCATDSFGLGGSATDRGSFNDWYASNKFCCTTSSVLTSIEQDLEITAPTNLVWIVHESDAQDGYYNVIATQSVAEAGTGRGWRSSGPMHVELKAGKYYKIGVVWQGTNGWAYYGRTSTNPASFGYIIKDENALPISDPAAAYAQKLTTCRVPRSLILSAPLAGVRYEPGDFININWYAGGVQWEPSDTVKIEYSMDSGATWLPLSGANNVPYNAGTSGWYTLGYPESDHYRVRITANADNTVTADSGGDFRLKTDMDAPVITHVALRDTNSLRPSYLVSATVIDAETGVGSVRLYWRRNGGQFTSATMSYNNGQYSAYIQPTPAPTVGDVYEYYIEATDQSVSRNKSTSPATGYYSFKVLPPMENLAEMFDTTNFDLQNMSITFTPDSRYYAYGPYACYTVCTKAITDLPTDPAGGNALWPGDNNNVQVWLTGGSKIVLFGQQYNSFYIGSNGYITLNAGDNSNIESYRQHFSLPRISAFFHDFEGPMTGTPCKISWKQLTDRVVVTYENAREKNTYDSNTFQVEMFFDGRITLSYLKMDAPHGLVGLSAGGGMPQSFWETDFSGYSPCSPSNMGVWDTIAPTNDGAVNFGVCDVGTDHIEEGRITNAGDSAVMVRDIRLLNLFEDFNDDQAQGWQENDDLSWSIGSGHYHARTSGAVSNPTSMYTGASFNDFYYEAGIRYSSQVSAGTANMVCRASSDFGTKSGLAYVIGLSYYQLDKAFLSITKQQSGQRQMLKMSAPLSASITDWNRVGVNAVGKTLEVYLNGSYVMSVTDSAFSSGRVGFLLMQNPNSSQIIDIDDVVVGPARPLDGEPEETYIVNGFGMACDSPLPRILAPGESIAFELSYAPQAMGESRAVVALTGMVPANCGFLLTGAGRGTVPPTSLKNMNDGSPVWLSGETVSAAFPDRFYIQDANRAGGIGVLWSGAMPAIGASVRIDGAMATQDGERVIVASAAQAGVVGPEPKPLGMNGRAIGGGTTNPIRGFPAGRSPVPEQAGVLYGSGLGNIGLLVRTWGEVVEWEPVTPPAQPTWFVIDDGSSFHRASTSQITTRILCPAGVNIPEIGSYVAVTGISSCYMDGTSPRRMIRVRRQSDLD